MTLLVQRAAVGWGKPQSLAMRQLPVPSPSRFAGSRQETLCNMMREAGLEERAPINLTGGIVGMPRDPVLTCGLERLERC